MPYWAHEKAGFMSTFPVAAHQGPLPPPVRRFRWLIDFGLINTAPDVLGEVNIATQGRRRSPIVGHSVL